MKSTKGNVEKGETQVVIRLPHHLLDRIVQHVDRLRRATPGVNVRRADAVRVLLNLGLDEAEKRERSPDPIPKPDAVK